MAFNYTTLFPSFAPCGGNVKEWAYTTTDTLVTVLASGYFNTVSSALGVGDIINVSVVNALPVGSRTSFTDAVPIVVTTNASGTVTTRVQEPTRYVMRHFDDFEGTTISTKFGVNKGSDGACANFAVSADINGKILATTGAGAGGTMAVNGVQLHSALNWKANQGVLAFEARVKISAITNIAVFVGLTNQVASLEAPVISAGSLDTITTNANDVVGFMFDTAMATDDIWLVASAATVDTTPQDSALAFVADTYKVLRVEVSTTGVATFYIDGVAIGTAMSAAVTATVALTPVVTAFTRTAASATISVDYISTQAYRV